MSVVDKSKPSETEKPRGLTVRVGSRVREMPILLLITASIYLVLPVFLISQIVGGLILEIVVHKQSVPPDTWWGVVILPLYVLPIFTVPGLIYHRPVFARVGLLALAVGFYGPFVRITAWTYGIPGAIWEYAIAALLLVGFPIYYLYFRKNVVAYFRRGRKVKV